MNDNNDFEHRSKTTHPINDTTKRIIQKYARKLDIAILRHSTYSSLTRNTRAYEDLKIARNLSDDKISLFVKNLDKSKSELRQDLIVLCELNGKRDGYFVEFGATNGVDISNTYLLEKEFGWNGILVEPARCWQKELKENRGCEIDHRCVWSASNQKLVFNEAPGKNLSTIDQFSAGDLHENRRKGGKLYEVETISLLELLEEYRAPREIDYLSIDTEGSEYEILSSFDFDKYNIRAITCEHNYSPIRKEIYELLTAKGYERKYENLSEMDDWYFKS